MVQNIQSQAGVNIRWNGMDYWNGIVEWFFAESTCAVATIVSSIATTH